MDRVFESDEYSAEYFDELTSSSTGQAWRMARAKRILVQQALFF